MKETKFHTLLVLYGIGRTSSKGEHYAECIFQGFMSVMARQRATPWGEDECCILEDGFGITRTLYPFTAHYPIFTQ